MTRFACWPLTVAALFMLWGCSGSDETTDAKGQGSDALAEASVDPDGGASDADNQPDTAGDLGPDLPQHPLVGTWSGNPVDCFTRTKKKPGIRMTFSPTEVSFYQFFMSGTNVCEHRGKGSVQDLTESSFQLVGYHLVSTTCNLGMFLQGDQNIAFEFLDEEKTSVFIDPDKEECFLLKK